MTSIITIHASFALPGIIFNNHHHPCKLCIAWHHLQQSSPSHPHVFMLRCNITHRLYNPSLMLPTQSNIHAMLHCTTKALG
jgi:hypothetical protein